MKFLKGIGIYQQSVVESTPVRMVLAVGAVVAMVLASGAGTQWF